MEESRETLIPARGRRGQLCAASAASGGGEGAEPGRLARRCPRLVAAPGAAAARTRPAEPAAPRRPVTGRGEAQQEVSSGSWVKVLRQERAPCAGSGRGLRQALVSLSRF